LWRYFADLCVHLGDGTKHDDKGGNVNFDSFKHFHFIHFCPSFEIDFCLGLHVLVFNVVQ
jgi:hypothetical protein